MIEVDEAVLNEYIKEVKQSILEEVVDKLDKIGLRCVNIARKKGDYTDRTGNLRNSIASAVVVDGKVVRANQLPGEVGAKTHQYIQELANENNEGIVLLLVASMNYAAYVEFGHAYTTKEGVRTTRPYDVIATAEDKAEELVDELLNQIKKDGIATD